MAPAGAGIEVLVYAADQKDLFARICSFFDRAITISSKPEFTPLVMAMLSIAFWC